MKAVVYKTGRGLVLEQVPDPKPGEGGVLVRVVDTGFCGSDHSLIAGGLVPDGYILGHETSGVVDQLGEGVQGPAVGTRVIIRPTFCGRCRDCCMGKPYFCQNGRRTIGVGDLPGGFAQYLLAFPDMLIPVPEGVDSENAALAEAFAAALHGIRCARGRGGSALVVGGGPIGLALMMLLKLLNFGPVVLSEPIEFKRRLAQDLGADAVLDPTEGDLRGRCLELTDGVGFNTVYECSGSQAGVSAAVDVAARGGTVCIVSVIFREIMIRALDMTFKELLLTASYSNTHEENRQILDWMARNKLDGRPLVSDRIHLQDLPRIYRERIETGKAVKVMVKIGDGF
ncbi:MAG: alcohol dehydrogenase catalytic domain-containing protein [Deltaproteobacteria bacterium]|nr:alcohol dehydrogenase catalytic domain-containing protein [Deltaproteobacteria bacterium]MBW1950218.1 alcohol dehydrogenase catalytic domain-containing protein [Deltaproteobacteria bacterium]MBW2348051.1 alcohol dehydrogenase catalytic domain-containing protein [Deltaproteobacteria bacterium]